MIWAFENDTNLKLVIRYHSVFKIIMVKQLQKN